MTVIICVPILGLSFIGRDKIPNVYILMLFTKVFPLVTCMYLLFGIADHVNGFLGFYDRSALELSKKDDQT